MVKIVIENLAQKEVAAIGLGTSVLKLIQANYMIGCTPVVERAMYYLQV
jgi:hypothetical protein